MAWGFEAPQGRDYEPIFTTGRVITGDGTAAAPAWSFASDPTLGFYRDADMRLAISGALAYRWSTENYLLLSNTAGLWMGAASDVCLQRDAANVLALRNGVNAQTLRVYNTYAAAGAQEWAAIVWSANIVYLNTDTSGGTARRMIVGPAGAAILTLSSSGGNQWNIDTSGHFYAGVDSSYTLGYANGTGRPSDVYLGGPAITAGSGTGVTVNDGGSLRVQTYKVTVTYAALAAAALTADKTIATLPAKTRLLRIVTETTTPYTGGGVTAATLILGKTVGGNEYVLSHDVFTAAINRGLVDGDLGASINRANAVQGGDLPSWTATTNISVRLTTVTANTDQLTAGSTTYYITTERYA